MRQTETRRTVTPAVEDAWDEDEQWERPVVRPPMRQVQAEPVYVEHYEEDNWGDDSEEYEEEYEEKRYVRSDNYREKPRVPDYQYDDDVESDAWADDEAPKPYKAPRVNIPEKTKTPEYEEEAGY